MPLSKQLMLKSSDFLEVKSHREIRKHFVHFVNGTHCKSIDINRVGTSRRAIETTSQNIDIKTSYMKLKALNY